MQHHKTTSLLLCALFTALLCVSAWIRIPTPLVPITLQSGVVLLAGVLLGPKRGAQCSLSYLLIGLFGVPVFSLGGGFGYILQPTFGYLLGFVVACYVTGQLVWKKPSITHGKLFLAALVGLCIIYFIGTVYCYGISVLVLGSELAFWPLVVSCCLLPLPGDLALCLLTAILGKRLYPYTRRYIS